MGINQATRKSQATRKRLTKRTHVLVCGNEKGGSGKTTVAIHLVASLLNAGFKVASIDLDTRQKSLTGFLENRLRWSQKNGDYLQLPDHYHLDLASSDSVRENRRQESEHFSALIGALEDRHDFIVIDTPGANSHLTILAHKVADTLITPVNDSFFDVYVLGRVDFGSGAVSEISHYAENVRDSRRHRMRVDNTLIDWIVVRNRISQLQSRNSARILRALEGLSAQLGYRIADGISERNIYRELYPLGLTVLDRQFSELDAVVQSPSHLAARREMNSLIHRLKLPTVETVVRQMDARVQWIINKQRGHKDGRIACAPEKARLA